MSIEVISIRHSGEPCDGCREPITKSHNIVRRKDMKDMVFCPSCYDFLLLSAEEKRRYVEEVKNKKQCFTCKIFKVENIRSFTFATGDARHVCTECINLVAPSAREKWSMNQLEMRTKINNKTE